MISLAALALAAAATAGASTSSEPARGVRIAAAEVRARILQPAIVRQASGVQQDQHAPVPQVRRSGRTILVEYQ